MIIPLGLSFESNVLSGPLRVTPERPTTKFKPKSSSEDFIDIRILDFGD
jgi:hypothetical protein